MGPWRNFRISVGLLVVSIAIQTAFLAVLPTKYRHNESTDYSSFYRPVAENVVAGRGLVDNHGQFASTYPPGYPLLIAFILGVSHLLNVNLSSAIDAANILLMAACALTIFSLMKGVFGSGMAYLTFLLWITYPANLWLIKQPNSEVPFMFVFFLGLLLFYMGVTNNRVLLGLASGLLIGLAALVRPIAVFVAVVFCCAGMLYSRSSLGDRARLSSSLAIGFLLAVLPWEICLYSQTGKLSLLCTNGPAAVSEGLFFGIESYPNSVLMTLSPDLSAFMEKALAARQSMKTLSGAARFILEEARRDPKGTMELALMKLYRPWYGTQSRRHEKLNLLYQSFYIILGAVGAVIGVRRYRGQIYWIAFFSTLFGYFWAMAFVAVPLVRYLVPAMAFIIVLDAFTVEELFEHFRRRAPLMNHRI